MRRLLAILFLAGCPAPSELCRNNVDDDGDGLADCDDPECGAACVENCFDGIDDDEDGYTDCDDPQCEGTCVEICGNGRDDDGDGRVDCQDSECTLICPEDCANGVDDDGDWIVDCADVEECGSTCDGDGDGFDGVALGGDDCDDQDAAINPGVPETYYDGVDNDCDPATDDQDQDADGTPVSGDCDDSDARRYPGAPEVCGDGVVDDCDATGVPPRETCYGERSLATADVVFRGTEEAGWVGFSVAAADDTDGDGQSDLVLGAYGTGPLEGGAAYVVHGPFAADQDLRPGACELDGDRDSDFAGILVANVGDLDGDGRPNLAVGARYEDNGVETNNGRVWVLRDPCVSGPVSANAWEIRGYANAEVGQSYAAAGDENGDGFDDLVVGIPLYDGDVQDQGGIYLVLGPLDGLVDLTFDANATLYGAMQDELSGKAEVSPGDLDGDGLSDLAVGAPFKDGAAGADSGLVYVVYAPVSGITDLNDHVMLDFAEKGGGLGSAFGAVGDLTGDGVDDLAVGAPADGAGPGSVTVVDAPDPLHIAATFTGDALDDNFGASLCGLRDMNGDGQGELVVGALGDDTAAVDAGAVLVFFGPTASGTFAAADADVRLLGEAAYDNAGLSVADGTDTDHDGFTDLLVGAPYHDNQAPSDGSAYLVSFGL